MWLLNRITQEPGITNLPALEEAATLSPFTHLINLNDERFINPYSIVDAIREACREQGQPVPQEDVALALLDTLPVSMRCWQGDDIAGFENPTGTLTEGIEATGNYPGKATNTQQLAPIRSRCLA